MKLIDVKRYKINDPISHSESVSGEWVKYSDLEIVLSIVKENVRELMIEANDLKRQSDELRATIATLQAISRDNGRTR